MTSEADNRKYVATYQLRLIMGVVLVITMNETLDAAFNEITAFPIGVIATTLIGMVNILFWMKVPFIQNESQQSGDGASNYAEQEGET